MLVADGSVLIKPAVTQMNQSLLIKFSPGEMAKVSTLVIAAMSRNPSSIEIGNAPILMKGTAHTFASLEDVVHMPKNYQVRRADGANLVER